MDISVNNLERANMELSKGVPINTEAGLALIAAMVLATAFFVAAEFSLVASNRKKIEEEASGGSRSAQTVLGLIKNLSYHLTGAQLGITVTAVVLGFIAEPTMAELIEQPLVDSFGNRVGQSLSLIIAISLVTFLTMVIGELIPKNIAIAKPTAMARLLAKPFKVYSFLAKPLIYVSDATANKLTRSFGVEPTEELDHTPSIEDLDLAIRVSAEEGTLGQRKVDLLSKSMKFALKQANDVMTPRVALHSLKAESTIEDLISLSLETGHSRFPITLGDLDNVLGIAHVKSALSIAPEKRPTVKVTSVMTDVIAVPETRDLISVMSDMRKLRRPVAIVVDEHGGTEGLVTVEDLLEEIVGEIEDEYDETERPQQTNNKGVFVLTGTLRLDEVEEICGLKFGEKPYETIAGFILDKLQRIPSVGEVFRYKHWKIEVLEMEKFRIASIRLSSPPFHSLDDSQKSSTQGKL
ncbi:MAG: hypothetical protein CL431_01540 [Acidimicrobiaceae bacterium]|jgi:CBS domain containing-hemolysin-like protein|nr:hypothetical protein [Acidimicrobiaceae bacterium]|tara:strand:+ start:82326 stop:83723 length:1398 start_codon:yes stop_codon:yes gene_type:complete